MYEKKTLSLLVTMCLVLALLVPNGVSALSPSSAQALSYVKIEGGLYYTVALRNDGTVWQWGRNLLGELGVNEKIRYRRTEAPIRAFGLSEMTDISVAEERYAGHNLAVKADGTVWQWGSAQSSDDYKTHSMRPRQIEGMSDAVAVSAGAYFGIAIRKDGTVWSWERYVNSQQQAIPRKPVAVQGLNDVVQISAGGGDGRAYAVKQDGSVWTWTEHSISTYVKVTEQTVPVKLKGLSNIRSVSVSGGSLLALDRQGKVWTVDEKGKVAAVHPELKIKEVRGHIGAILLLTTAGDVYGYGHTVNGKQGKVNGLPKIVAIGAGTYHNLAISTDGKAWGWGGDKYMELGAPATSYGNMVYRPIQANDEVDVMLNGESLPMSYTAILSTHTVQVPMKELVNAIGAKLQVGKDETGAPLYKISYEGYQVSFQLGQNKAWVGTKAIELADQVEFHSGAITVPHTLMTSLGFTANWDPLTRTVSLSKQSEQL